MMPILELRILPPFAIARLGGAAEPLEAFELETNPGNPFDYRRIVPRPSFQVDPESGEITCCYVPESIRFKDDNQLVRPVAPFLEVYARTSHQPDQLVPLTVDLLKAENLTLQAVHWKVELGNIKIYRRTNDQNDKIYAKISQLNDHKLHPIKGECANFLPNKTLPLGHVQFIKPTECFPEIRLRFTPAKGLVYGASLKRHISDTEVEDDPVFIHNEDLILYDCNKGSWRGYKENLGPELTMPAQIYAGYNDDAGNHVSWGYFDDECDGVVRVILKLADGNELRAQGHIGAGPPAYAPDTLPVRVISDEMEQILYGPSVAEEEVSLDDATELVLRALESVRLMNTAVMNGNPVNGRLNTASTMVRQNTNDFERYYEPIAASSLVDNLALRALHERVFSALTAGGAPWFPQLLRQPEEIGDLSAKGLRKMPALMRGADGRSLTLTRRHIDMVTKAAKNAMFAAANPTHKGAKDE
ncbi:hypothetical protein [Nitrosomonas communis]|nr:hypothetical protein [Nitrosomonas communis]